MFIKSFLVENFYGWKIISKREREREREKERDRGREGKGNGEK